MNDRYLQLHQLQETKSDKILPKLLTVGCSEVQVSRIEQGKNEYRRRNTI